MLQPAKSSDIGVQDVPAIEAPLLQAVKEAAQVVQGYITPESSQSDRVEPLTSETTQSAAMLGDLLARIGRASGFFKSLNDLVGRINALGALSTDRSSEEGAALITPIVEQIYKRVRAASGGTTPAASAAEIRLLNVYKRANDNKLHTPAWYAAASAVFDSVARCEKLPGPEEYLAVSPSAAKESSQLRAEYTRLKAELQMLRQSRDKDAGPSGDKTEQAIAKLDDIAERLDKMLLKASDVAPEQVETCCRQAKVEVVVSPEVVRAMLDLRRDLAAVIERLALGMRENMDPIRIQLAEPRGAKGIIKSLDKTALSADPILNEDSRSEKLGVLLKHYAAIHASLIEVNRQWSSNQPGRDEIERRQTGLQLASYLRSVFVGENHPTRRILTAMTQYKSAAIEECVAELLTAPVVEDDPHAGTTVEFYLDKLENIELLGQALAILVRGTDQAAEIIRSALGRSTLSSLSELGSSVRSLLDKGDTSTLVRVFDDELLNLQRAGPSSLTEKAIVLHALSLAADDEGARRGLKGRLKCLEIVDSFVSSLLNKAPERSPEAEFIERVRAKIARRFSSNLSDYWGNRELVQRWRGMIEDHLMLLANPNVWVGIPPNQVFYNGYVLHGEPGAGKSFLVTCMANELELPLHIISREDMARAYQVAEKQRQSFRDADSETPNHRESDLIEATLNRVLERRIEQVQSEKIRSGAKASIVFIDEMEAEFLRRDPQTSPREELTRTNIMLRVIERLITKHPDIIFGSATNHIGLVDEAALRLGRYGCHLEVRLPNQEDVVDILKGCFDRLALTTSDGVLQSDQYADLVSECIGMSPLDIQLAVNNAVTLQRIRSEADHVSMNEELLQKLTEKVLLTKKLDGRKGIKASSAAVEDGSRSRPSKK